METRHVHVFASVLVVARDFLVLECLRQCSTVRLDGFSLVDEVLQESEVMEAHQIEQLLLNLFIGLLRGDDVQQIDVRISSVQGRHIALLVRVLQVFVEEVLEPVELMWLNLLKVDIILLEVVVILEYLLLNLVAFRVIQVEVGVRLRCD